jgi:hypothetical protein
MTMNCLRPRLAGGVRHPSFVRLLIVAAMAALGVGSGPATAGSGPERPPVNAPAKIAPEPAPVAVTPRASVDSVQSTQPSTQQPSATAARRAAVTSSRPVEPRTAHRAEAARTKPAPSPARHRTARAVKTLTHAIQTPAIRIAVAATPPSATDSNSLLFVGGLALLFLVLGDAAFLALSARVLRESTNR